MEYNVDLPHVGIPVAKMMYYLCLYSTHRTEYIIVSDAYSLQFAYLLIAMHIVGKEHSKKKSTCSLHKIVDYHSVYITATWSQIAK